MAVAVTAGARSLGRLAAACKVLEGRARRSALDICTKLSNSDSFFHTIS
jgi:hypothetical protein